MISCGMYAARGVCYDDGCSLSHILSLTFLSNRSGGMPDDTTVVVMHVVGRDADDLMDSTNM
jgi:hypothetical protein